MPDPINRQAELERAAALARVRRHRARQAGLLPPVPRCEQCGCMVIQEATLPLCSTCWRRTPAGRAAQVERYRAYRARRRSDA